MQVPCRTCLWTWLTRCAGRNRPSRILQLCWVPGPMSNKRRPNKPLGYEMSSSIKRNLLTNLTLLFPFFRISSSKINPSFSWMEKSTTSSSASATSLASCDSSKRTYRRTKSQYKKNFWCNHISGYLILRLSLSAAHCRAIFHHRRDQIGRDRYLAEVAISRSWLNWIPTCQWASL